MNLKLWLAKVLTNRILKQERRLEQMLEFVKRLREQKAKTEERLSKILKKFSQDENLQYGLKVGFIDQEEYELFLKEKKEKE